MTATSADKKFWCDYIELYKEQPCLQKGKSKDYSNKTKRNAAYDILLETLQEKDPTAIRDCIDKKILLW